MGTGLADTGMVGILLAGGYGRRYAQAEGGDKLLARLPDGRPVAVASAQALRAAAGPGPDTIWAVVRPESTELAALLAAEGCRIVATERAREGMGASLAAAAALLLAERPAQHCVVALADMPWVRPDTVARIATLAMAGPHAAVAPWHRGRRGHPVAFGAALWPALAQLAGDVGAREVLAGAAGVHRYDTEDAGVLADVDVPDDLARVPHSPSSASSPEP